MSNILFYSDLHIRPETHSTCEIVLKAIGELALKHKALIVNGGDTHNTRGILKTSSVDILTRHYQNWAAMGLRQHILIGNHDQEDRAGEIHPMRAFNWEGWRVIDVPTTIEGIAYFPYMPREDIQDAIKLVPKTCKVAVVHWGIQGAKRNDWNTDTDGIPVEWLSKFKQVFSGHYHFRNDFENVQYIGSPYQQNFAEANQPKGVLLYDKEKNKIKFIEIENTPKHHKVSWRFEEESKTPSIEGDFSSIKKCDFVEVQIEGDSEQVNTINHEDLRKHFDCENIKFNRNGRVKSYSRLGITSKDVLDSPDLMQKYVDFIDTSLDRKKLMEVGRELLGQ